MEEKQKTKAGGKLKRNLKREIRRQKGITLIALIITIVILIILATISINIIFGDEGLIKRAEQAKELHEQGASDEEKMLNDVDEYLTSKLEGTSEEETEIKTVKEARDKEIEFKSKKVLKDEVGNNVTIPAGFKVAKDSEDTVQGGVVIEDVSASTDEKVQGSQFVWIPVGEFIKDDKSTVEIVLGRYTFSGTMELANPAYTEENPESYKNEEITYDSDHLYEYLVHRDGVNDTGEEGLNATAYELEKWIISAKNNNGYYIGRYEASYANGAESEENVGDYNNCKSASKISKGFSSDNMKYISGNLWTHITQLNASKVAINTYADSNSIKSDLINSYAWDTAICFIMEATGIDYMNNKTVNTELGNTGNLGGELKDEVCKINDMASNLMEWTTEYNPDFNSFSTPCIRRGGSTVMGETNFSASLRNSITIMEGLPTTFRLTLYFEE